MNSLITRLTRWQGRSWWNHGLLILASMTGTVVLSYLLIAGQVRLAIMVAILVPMIGMATVNIRAAMLSIMVYLVLMGDLRRMLIPLVGWTGTDPLLLVGAILSALVLGFALASRSVRFDTPLARWILALMAVMVLQIFNPKQGGLLIGIAGAMFYIVPLLWFWAGRTYATPALMKALFYKVVVPLAVLAALMGFYQSFYGYLPYQQQWYEVAGYTALGAEGIQAPISFFASSAEYGNYMIIAVVLLWAAVLLEKQRAALILIALFLVAAFLTGSRGPMVKVLVTSAALWAVMGKVKAAWIARGALALLIAGLGLVWSLSQVEEVGGNARIQHRVQRQAEGLLNPLEEGSSAMGHLNMMVLGYKRALQEPLGLGLGATTKAASKFGGKSVSMEVDSSDIFISTGIIGGAIYLVIMFLIILSALRYWTRTRSLLALGILGILGVIFLLWLRGGQYAVSTLVWFCIGALDRFQNMRGPDDASS